MTTRDDFSQDHTMRVHATVERNRRADAVHLGGWTRVWAGPLDITIRRDLSDAPPTAEQFATQAATTAVSHALDTGWYGMHLAVFVMIDGAVHTRMVDLSIGMTTRVIQQGPVAG